MKQPNFDRRASETVKSKNYKNVIPMTNFTWKIPQLDDDLEIEGATGVGGDRPEATSQV